MFFVLMMTPHAANALRTYIRATKSLRTCPWHLSGEINTHRFMNGVAVLRYTLLLGLPFLRLNLPSSLHADRQPTTIDITFKHEMQRQRYTLPCCFRAYCLIHYVGWTSHEDASNFSNKVHNQCVLRVANGSENNYRMIWRCMKPFLVIERDLPQVLLR